MRAKLTEGSEAKHLLKLGGPMMIGIIAIIGFNVVDTFFVAQLGARELAAISYTFPVVTVMASIAIGLGVGLSSLVSRLIGAGQIDAVRCITTDGLSLSFVIVTILSILGLLTINPLFKLLGAEADTIPLISDYMEIWYLNMIFVVVPMVGNSAIRATGNTTFPATIMVVAGVINAILDPILIFGLLGAPRMELQGAALATLISRMVTLVAALYVLHHKKKMLISPFRPIAEVGKNWVRIFNLSAVSALNSVVVPLSAGVITALISTYGEDAVAAFGIGTRIEALIIVPLLAFSSALGPFSGQNWGAKQYNRISQAVYLVGGFGVCWLTLCFAFFWFSGEWLVGLFSDSVLVLSLATEYLLIVTLSLAVHGFLMNVNTAYSATGRPMIALILTTIRIVGVYIPAAMVLKWAFGLTGIFLATALANVGGGLIALYTFRYQFFTRLRSS